MNRFLSQQQCGKQSSSGCCPNPRLQQVLANSEFSVFQPLADLGYYSWIPNNAKKSESQEQATTTTTTSDLSSTSVSQVQGNLCETGQPPLIADIHGLLQKHQLPLRFASLPAFERKNVYPNAIPYEMGPWVAARRGWDLDTVDFCLGGSTLEVLATNTIPPNTNYLVSRLLMGTHEKMILIAKHHEYIQNYNAPSFQFERLATGRQLDDAPDGQSTEHVHVLKIGDQHTVLIAADVDAMDEYGDGVEIKASDPRYWGTRLMFQMLSSGSLTLVWGNKKQRGTTLVEIQRRSLEWVMATALQKSGVKQLETQLVNNLQLLQKASQDLLPGDVRVLRFQPHLTLDNFSGNSPFLPKAVSESLFAQNPSKDA